jgi:hypothetical protein
MFYARDTGSVALNHHPSLGAECLCGFAHGCPATNRIWADLTRGRVQSSTDSARKACHDLR